MPGKYTGKTRAEVRAMVLANNKNKNASDESVQSMTHELKLWRLQNRASKNTKTTKSKKREVTTVPGWVSADGTAGDYMEVEKQAHHTGEHTNWAGAKDADLTRDETYSDYATEIRGEAPAEDLFKKSGPPKRSTFKMKGWSGYQNKKQGNTLNQVNINQKTKKNDLFILQDQFNWQPKTE